MSSPRTLVLNHDTISQKIKRIAYQIYEYNYDDTDIVFVAIEHKGVILADRIKPILESVSKIKVQTINLSIDKKAPIESMKLSSSGEAMKGKSVILIDDVLNSGNTLIHAASFLLSFELRKLTTVVLVDRRHRLFPIKADFVGLTLSTTLQDHISVEFSDGNDAVYLE